MATEIMARMAIGTGSQMPNLMKLTNLMALRNALNGRGNAKNGKLRKKEKEFDA